MREHKPLAYKLCTYEEILPPGLRDKAGGICMKDGIWLSRVRLKTFRLLN